MTTSPIPAHLNGGGGYVVEDWREQWKKQYDFVLIDCQPGISDIGGMCTIQLPDVMLLLFTADEDELDEAVAVARKVTEARAELPVDRLRLLTIPILSRYEATIHPEEVSESATMNRVEERVADFYRGWLPSDIHKQTMLLTTRIPNKRLHGVKSRLAVTQMADTPAIHELGFAYEKLSAVLAHGLDDLKGLQNNSLAYIEQAKKNVPRSAPKGEEFLAAEKMGQLHALWVSTGGLEGKRGNFSNRLLHSIDFSKMRLDRAIFVGADMSAANLSGAFLTDADLTNAILREANLRNVKASGAKLGNADLFKADLSRANFALADFQHATLEQATLVKADFTDARLNEANLAGADLEGATLVKANFTDARLNEANLVGADLRGATLREADLSSATINNVYNLRLSQLSGAKLSDAKLAEDFFEDEELVAARRHALFVQALGYALLAACAFMLFVAVAQVTDAQLLANRGVPLLAQYVASRTFFIWSPLLLCAAFPVFIFGLWRL